MGNYKKTALRDEWIKKLPHYHWTGNVHVLSEPDHLDELLSHKQEFYKFDGQSIIGFDSESEAVFIRGQISPLGIIQIATMSDVWIICRAFQLRNEERLLTFLRSHKKVGFGIRDDIKKVGLNLGSYLEIETLGEEPEGVIPKGCPPGARNLCARLFGLRLSRRFQMTTVWHECPLSEGAISYGADDVSMHLKIYVELMERRQGKKVV